MPIDNLIASFFQDPVTFSLVTGVGMGQPPASDAQLEKSPPGALPAAPEILVFVEPAADCELQTVWDQIRSKIPGEPFRLLITGRFVGLQATTGSSVSLYAPRRYNVPPVSAGTAGAIAQAGGRQYILGSNHVLAFNGRALPDTAVAAPGTLDDRKGGVVVGKRSFFVPLDSPIFRPWTPQTAPASPAPPARNFVDCALAELTPAGISRLGTLQNVAVADPVTRPTNVFKTGRTTGLTHSTTSTWVWRGYIDFSFGTYEFGDLMVATLLRSVGPSSPRQDTFAAPGDSGSLVLIDDPAKKGLGLVMARAFCSGVFAPRPAPAFPALAPGAFVGYHVLLCSLKTVRDRLQALPGFPGSITFQRDT